MDWLYHQSTSHTLGDMTIPDDRTAVWLAMANQFLDSEERPDIPQVALVALEAGLTVDEAHRVWMYEVAPALAPNLWSVAGEWGAWDPDFVVKRVRMGASDPRRHHVWGLLGYGIAMAPFLGMFRAIGATMAVLAEVDGEARAQRARELTWLAQHFFDIGAWPASPGERPRLAQLYDTCFHRAMGAVIFASERAAGAERVARAVAS